MDLEINCESTDMENIALLQSKYEKGEQLLKKLSEFSNIVGIQKLERRISAELRFLEKVSKLPEFIFDIIQLL